MSEVGGGSAYREAERSRLRRAALLKAAEFEAAREACFRAAGHTERRVTATVRAMASWGWQVLADRRWPGTRAANIDLVAIGPGGVLVIDVKAWAEARVTLGRLYRGQEPADDDLDKLLRIAATVEDHIAPTGLAPQLIRPVLVLAGRSAAPTVVGRALVLGEQRLPQWIARLSPRLAADRVDELTALLAEALPPYRPAVRPAPGAFVPEPALPREPEQCAAEQLSIVDTEELVDALVAAEFAKPVHEWMTFLHPAQAALVRRRWNGPVRIRGPAGTGKTVTALHRGAYLAATRPGRILFTGYVRTLPPALGELYRQLSPETADRVEFVGLDAWATRFLELRGRDVRLDSTRLDHVWRQVWPRADPMLSRLVPDPGYWRIEINDVIRARGLCDFAEYAALERLGRKVPLRHEHRAAVWDLYVSYRSELVAAGVMDWYDVLAAALDEVGRSDPGYQAVIVDEVTDLNVLGLRLVAALAGDRPDALLLLGDGRQAVYPGGARLAEAGIDVTGRAVVLRTNYRNTAAVLEAAARLVPSVASADPDDQQDAGVTGGRPGGRPARWMTGGYLSRHDDALIADLRSAAGRHGLAGLAVLCDTRRRVDHYLRLLADNDIPVVPLTDYAGGADERVKVGTYKRAKGLEFAAVFLPWLPPRIDTNRYSDPASTERAELLDRELHVAATRARDELWLGPLGWPEPEAGRGR